MDNTKKYIGESPIKENPQKKLKIKLTDGAVTTDKIADKSITVNKLGEDVTAVIQDIDHYGVMVAQEFGDNANISISQRKLTEEVQSIHAVIDSHYYDN